MIDHVPAMPAASLQARPSAKTETAPSARDADPVVAAPAERSDLVVRKAPRSERLVYEFRDPQTGQLTKQFPSEASLAIGALYDEKV
ncbi:MAG: hypothetical protein AAGD40_00375 [Pseudomonadota bacterium]